MSPRAWAWVGFVVAMLVSVSLMVLSPGAALEVPPLMVMVGMARILTGGRIAAVLTLLAIVAVVAAHGPTATSAYLVGILIVAAVLADRVGGGIRRSQERADRSLGLLSVLISALHRVAEAPGARDAEATLPGLLEDRAGDGLLVWRTTVGEPEAVAGAAQLDDAGAVIGAVRRVVGGGAAIDTSVRVGGRVRHLAAVPVYERSDVVAVFTAFREEPLSDPERAIVQAFTGTLGHVLTRLHEKRTGELVLRLVQDHDGTPDTAPMARALLDVLVPELGVWGAAVMRYRAGRFVAEVVRGSAPEGLERRLERGLVYDEGVIWDAYRGGEALYIDAYRRHPGASGELAAYGVEAAAVVPIVPGAGSHAVLALFDHHERTWRTSERVLVGKLVAVLRASLSQRESEARFAEIARLQRDLLHTPVEEMYRRLLDAAVRLMPGSETASLLVRGEDGLFRYAAVIGFDAHALRDVSFTIEAMALWYGDGDGWSRGEPRILCSRQGRSVSDVSALTSPSEELRRGGRVDEIAADLCLPVLYRGEVLAILNLDAMHDPDAFGPAAVTVAASLVPFVGSVLHEADARRRLALAARTDELTGLANRRAFNEQADQDITRAIRYGESLALLIMDLSGFKQVNDGFGHGAGDDALKAVADALREASRAGDRLFRWGGDEFAALLAHADGDASRVAAQRMAIAIAAVATPAGPLGVNIGVAHVPDDGTDVDALVRVADGRMFRAKASGAVMVESGASD